LGWKGVLTHPNCFFLDTIPAPLVHLRLADVQLEGKRLECVVIPVGADLEALLKELDLFSGSSAASADGLATSVDSGSWRVFSRRGCLAFSANTHLVSCEDSLLSANGALAFSLHHLLQHRLVRKAYARLGLVACYEI